MLSRLLLSTCDGFCTLCTWLVARSTSSHGTCDEFRTLCTRLVTLSTASFCTLLMALSSSWHCLLHGTCLLHGACDRFYIQLVALKILHGACDGLHCTFGWWRSGISTWRNGDYIPMGSSSQFNNDHTPLPLMIVISMCNNDSKCSNMSRLE